MVLTAKCAKNRKVRKELIEDLRNFLHLGHLTQIGLILTQNLITLESLFKKIPK